MAADVGDDDFADLMSALARQQRIAPETLFAACCQLLEGADPRVNRLLPELEHFPHFIAGWLALTRSLLRRGKPEAAAAALQRALAAGGVAPEPVLAVALALFDRGAGAAAAPILKSAVRQTPDDARLWCQLGRSHYAGGRLVDAEQALLRAVTLNADDGETWFRLGLVMQDLKRPQEAVDAYRRALEVRPGLWQAALNLGTCLQTLHDIDGAMQAYQRAYALEPSTFNRIAQALSSAASGRLWFDLERLRERLRHPT